MSGFRSDHPQAPPPLSGLLHRPKHVFLPRCPDFLVKKIRPQGKKASDLSGFWRRDLLQLSRVLFHSANGSGPIRPTR